MKIETFLTCVVAGLVLYRILVYLFSLPCKPKPDPWDISIAHELAADQCTPVCHRCFTPQNHHGWFCPECGAVVGPYTNYMPNLNAFSQGEVLRNGTTHHLPRSPVVIIGCMLLPLAIFPLLAPVYWYYVFQNLKPRHEPTPDNIQPA
jgi:hypothetical protein